MGRSSAHAHDPLASRGVDTKRADPWSDSCCFGEVAGPSEDKVQIVPQVVFTGAPWLTIRHSLFQPVCNGELSMPHAARALSDLIREDLKGLCFKMLQGEPTTLRAKRDFEDGYNKSSGVALYLIDQMRDSSYRYYSGNLAKIERSLSSAPAIFSNQFLFGAALKGLPEDQRFLQERPKWQLPSELTLAATMRQVVLDLLSREASGPNALLQLLSQHKDLWAAPGPETTPFRIWSPPAGIRANYRAALGAALERGALEILQLPSIQGRLLND